LTASFQFSVQSSQFVVILSEAKDLLALLTESRFLVAALLGMTAWWPLRNGENNPVPWKLITEN